MHIYSFNYNFSASNVGLYTYLPIRVISQTPILICSLESLNANVQEQ